eukprot:4978129-Pyramimonas_sp.AAC.1
MRQVSHVGDPVAFREYVKENESRLKAEADFARASARAERTPRFTGVPFTNPARCAKPLPRGSRYRAV